MSESASYTWPADVARLNLPGGMTGSWKQYTPSVLLASISCPRNTAAYIYLAEQLLSRETINAIAIEADTIGNAVLSVQSSEIIASIGTLRAIAWACMALSSGATSFVEVGSGYGAFALILDRVATALSITITNFTACDIAASQTVQTTYLPTFTSIQNLSFISIESNALGFLGTPNLMMYSNYALSELPVAARSLLIANILPQCSMLFWVWSSPDHTGIPLDATTAPEVPSTGRNTIFVTRGFTLTLTL